MPFGKKKKFLLLYFVIGQLHKFLYNYKNYTNFCITTKMMMDIKVDSEIAECDSKQDSIWHQYSRKQFSYSVTCLKIDDA